ncbi:MAG: DNA-directed RNA polymerase subunit K [Candidatus Woesearchaeota archaeon]|nr:DNA-directed RNA polymerase subunit K [Candidatus Woesearchaeota archaeon]
MVDETGYTKYERARIIGARALQIAQGAPILVELSEKELEAIKYNPVAIAKREFEAGVITIDIKREVPADEPAAA